MKFIDKMIKDGVTSKDIRNNQNLQGLVFAELLADGLEYYEKGELIMKKLRQLNERNVNNRIT